MRVENLQAQRIADEQVDRLPAKIAFLINIFRTSTSPITINDDDLPCRPAVNTKVLLEDNKDLSKKV